MPVPAKTREIWGKPSPGTKKLRRSAGTAGAQLVKNFCREESTQVGAGELEGAAARLEWDRMP